MKTGKKNVTLWCKEARFGKKGMNFQALLEQALKGNKKVASRKESIASKEFRFINEYQSSNNALFGIACVYEEDKSELLISDVDNAEKLTISEMVPPKDGDARRHFLDGLLYFMVYKNHVLIVQSASFRSQAFEDHAGWLLNKSKLLKAGETFCLADQIVAATRKQISQKHVKDVTISAPIVNTPTDSKGNPKALDRIRKLELKGLGVDLLQKIAPHYLTEGRLLDAVDSRIECALTIKYKYKVDEKEQALLDDIAVTLRDVDGADAVLHLGDGTRITGDKLRLQGRLTIHTTNGVLNSTHVFQEMRGWMESQISSGQMSA